MKVVATRTLGLALLAGVLVLAGCQRPPPAPSYPEITFAQRGAILFDAAALEIVNEYVPPLRDPHVDHRFPVTPWRAVERWARDRLATEGRSGNRVVLRILDARAIETPLERTGGLRGVFTTDQTERYDLTIEATIEVQSPEGRELGFVRSRASRATSVAEGITLNAREQAWYDLTRGVMQDLDASLENQIRQHLNPWVLR